MKRKNKFNDKNNHTEMTKHENKIIYLITNIYFKPK